MNWLRNFVHDMAQEIALGYAWIALTPSWRAGIAFALLTALDPVRGAVGLLAAVCAWLAAYAAGAQTAERPVAVFNGLLCGLFAAHVWQPGVGVVALAVLGGVLAGWLSVVLGRLSNTLVQLPVLSLPFALVAMLTGAAGGSLSTLHYSAYVAPVALFDPTLDAFFSAFSGLYFMAEPLAGVLIVAVLLLSSRYYLLLAALGCASAMLCMDMLGAAPEHLASTGWLGNAILSALLVGGLFAVPSFATAALAVLAAVFAAWLSLGLGRMLDSAHLVPYSIPFVLSAWLVLYAAMHNARIATLFNVHAPDFPERTYERTCVARARVGEAGSIGLALPFAGAWTVSQGFSGAHTHRGLWRHALDFVVLKDGKSFANRGSSVEDFYCFGRPVLSPAYGQVWSVVSHVADNTPGAVNVVDNWGNYVVIRMANGKFVLVAHLQSGTVAVQAGAWLSPGDLLGQCGNSGRSPQPHIHMHVQTAAEPGSPTAPFHLANVMVAQNGLEARYELSLVPTQGAEIYAAALGDALPFFVYAGRGLRYSVARSEHAATDWAVHCEVNVSGRLQLVSSKGARCFVESTWAVFSCFERNDVPDVSFDMWLLGCGYTPASMQVAHWAERCTPARLLPDALARLWAVVAWPLAAFATSRYQRHWDMQVQGWRQTAVHTQRVTGLQARVDALLMPQLGCTAMAVEAGRQSFVFLATHSFQRADLGVPAWESKLPMPSLPLAHSSSTPAFV